jgi:hypothetical protein
MDLATIEIPKEEAQRAFEQYRAAVKERHSNEDEQIMRGYKALAKGQQIISLRQAMERGGLDHRGLPRLAICRADAEWCWVRMPVGQGAVTFCMDEWLYERATRRYVRLPSGVFPDFEREFNNRQRPTRATAMVPTVPPGLRPRGKLTNYHILWEAEWKVSVPRDPALLRRIGGDLYAVLAVWNLTELERAVLAGRLDEE